MCVDNADGCYRKAVCLTNFYASGRTGEVQFATFHLACWCNNHGHLKLLWGQIKVRGQKYSIIQSAFGQNAYLRDWYYGMGSHWMNGGGSQSHRSLITNEGNPLL